MLNFRILFIFQKFSALPLITLEYSVNLDKKIIFFAGFENKIPIWTQKRLDKSL